MGILTGLNKIVSRKTIADSENLQRQDLLNQQKNRDLIEDISQRQGILINSGLSEAEKQYILSDSMISSAIQMYLADVTSICDKSSCVVTSDIPYTDEQGELAKKVERVKYVFSQIYSNRLTESIIINLLNNGEIFLETDYNKGTNSYSVNETSYNRCVQLCFANGETAVFTATNEPTNNDNYYQYNYNLNNNNNRYNLIDAHRMVRIYNPSLSCTKVCVELEQDDPDDNALYVASNGNSLYYSGSISLLKQVYSDWLNSKLLELAVYRDRIAKSRFIQLIAIELGRTSRITSDQIYDSVKEYFDKRAVIDLEQQTFKSVVGNEPFTDYKVYTTRNGNGKLTFDNSLNGHDANVSALADLDYNQNKVFAGLGIPKQYLGANDDGSALSNGSSLFFMDEKYQKRVVSYVKRIAEGYKQAIKNLIYQHDNTFFDDWDFELSFIIPENNEDVMRVKNAKVDYANALIDLLDKVQQSGKVSVDAVTDIIDEDLRKLIAEDNAQEQ